MGLTSVIGFARADTLVMLYSFPRAVVDTNVCYRRIARAAKGGSTGIERPTPAGRPAG